MKDIQLTSNSKALIMDKMKMLINL